MSQFATTRQNQELRQVHPRNRYRSKSRTLARFTFSGRPPQGYC